MALSVKPCVPVVSSLAHVLTEKQCTTGITEKHRDVGIWPIKMAPFGATFKRRNWWAMSGKAKQDTVPPARTVSQEVTLCVEESEGHTRVCGLLVRFIEAFAAPKPKNRVIAITQSVKPLSYIKLGSDENDFARFWDSETKKRSAEQCTFRARPCQAHG